MVGLTRRALVTGAAGAMLLPMRDLSAQNSIQGRICYIEDGNIKQWSTDGIVTVKEDGAAQGPTWQPGTDMMMYVRDGGSFSNLITLDTESGRTRRLTNSESREQEGSEIYVASSVWMMDPCWSESGIVVFASTADDPYGLPQLWILRFEQETMFLAPMDGSESGQVSKVSVDAAGRLACYTLTGVDNVAYIGLRNLDTGQASVAMEGARGAYDGAISPDGEWIVGTIRDSAGQNDLWIVGVGEETGTRLTQGEQASCAVWNPRGEWIAYLAYVDGGFSLRAFKLDLSGYQPKIDGDIDVLIEKANIDSTSRLTWG